MALSGSDCSSKISPDEIVVERLHFFSKALRGAIGWLGATLAGTGRVDKRQQALVS
jgi:hypothetical protein